MPSAHRKEVFGTLRFRLTLWNTAVVLVFVLFTLWGAREGLRFEFWREADFQLQEDTVEIRQLIELSGANLDAVKDSLNRKAETHTHRGLYIRIFDESRECIYTSPNAPAPQLSWELFESRKQPVVAGEYHVRHFQLDKPGMRSWTVRVGASFAPLEEDIEQVTRLLLVVGSITLLISPLGGYWLAGRATRPIAQIIDTTGRLHPSSLSERLPLRGTRDELDRLSATINGFLDRIAHYLAQNREFTSNAAHELRSPLAAIQNSLEVALNADRTPEEYRELLGEILDECDGLRALVNQLLILAETDAGRTPLAQEPVQIDSVVRKTYDMFLGVAESAAIDLQIVQLDRCRVLGDASRLRQVVNNLVDNAIKFTRAGGIVALRLWRETSDQTVRLSVRDTGSGIPKEDLPHIFSRFYRGDKTRQRDRASRGTGLGLAICQSIVAAYNGRIEVESVVDQGTTMTVIIPAVGRGASESGSDPVQPILAEPAS
ncbi:MAG: HAMP domain-containing protein [Planctomycetes bacterium]|nr:HAMP domain-containing protein [Planctomycetota bacterium]